MDSAPSILASLRIVRLASHPSIKTAALVFSIVVLVENSPFHICEPSASAFSFMSLTLMLTLGAANSSSLTAIEQVTLFYLQLLVLSRKRKRLLLKIYHLLSLPDL